MASYSSDNLQDKAESKDSTMERSQSNSEIKITKIRPKPVLAFGISFIAIGAALLILGVLVGVFIMSIAFDSATNSLNSIPGTQSSYEVPWGSLDPAFISTYDKIHELPEMHRLPSSNEIIQMLGNLLTLDNEQLEKFMMMTVGVILFLLIIGIAILLIGKAIVEGNPYSKHALIGLLVFSGAAILFAAESKLYIIGFCAFVALAVFYLRLPKAKQYFVKVPHKTKS